MLKLRIKKTDHFDTERFLSDAIGLLTPGLATIDQWQRLREQADAKEAAAKKTLGPWELLNIDWDEFHPKARTILDDPFYWDLGNDFAPNGNDTGTDLLFDFQEWNKRRQQVSPLRFLDGLMEEWGFSLDDWDETDPAKVREIYARDRANMFTCNEAIIALAFAAIKTRGECPADLLQRALAGLRRAEILFDQEGLEERHQSEQLAAIAKMRAKLQSLPQ